MKTKTSIKFTPIIFALSLLLTAFSQRDIKLDQQIVGTWTCKAEDGALTFDADGRFSGVVGKSATNTLAGTWQIKGKDLILTLSIGGGGQCKIISMDAHEFVFISGGKSVTYSR